MATTDTLFSFAAKNPNTFVNATGANPYAGLIADAQGNLYGTTTVGGTNGFGGTVYALVEGANGYTEQTLYSFAAPDGNGANATGAQPFAGLITDAQGNFYGTTPNGGTNGGGAVFELVKGANGYTQQTLFSFAKADFNTNISSTGSQPEAPLTADIQGNLFGTTVNGGANGTGAVFELVKGANGYAEQTLFSFAAKSSQVVSAPNTTGASPYAGLTADAQGNFYGTTSYGGAGGTGTVYELVKGANGYMEQTIYSFAAQDVNSGVNTSGAQPYGMLITDVQGNLYGTAINGGMYNTGTVYELVKGANGFTQQTLFNFAARGDNNANATGSFPYAGLTVDANGNLFGTTTSGGTNGTGAVYELVKGANGYMEQMLVSFAAADPNTSANTTGGRPYAGLIADAQGNLYGTTYTGGTNGTGAVYRVSDTGFSIPCYCTGTRIRVLRDGTQAEVAVEALRVGDLAVTADGMHRPIRWLGHRTIAPRRHPHPNEAQPVRIRAGALGPNKPARDLRVSPGHSIAVDVLGTVLIPAAALVNGTSIVQEDVDSVTYWHIELDSHDLLMAEDLPAESYLDTNNRGFFAENSVVALYASPDAAGATHADFCRPFHGAGALVAAVNVQIAARARQIGWLPKERGPDEDLSKPLDKSIRCG